MNKKLKEQYEKIEQSIKACYSDELNLINTLRNTFNFSKYSGINKMLILNAKPDAQFVLTFKQWQDLGYKVNKNAKGIELFAPVFITLFHRGDKNYIPLSQATDDDKTKIDAQIYPSMKIINFYRSFYVFDITDTNATLDDIKNDINKKHTITTCNDIKSVKDTLINYYEDTFNCTLSVEKDNISMIKRILTKTSNQLELNDFETIEQEFIRQAFVSLICSMLQIDVNIELSILATYLDKITNYSKVSKVLLEETDKHLMEMSSYC